MVLGVGRGPKPGLYTCRPSGPSMRGLCARCFFVSQIPLSRFWLSSPPPRVARPCSRRRGGRRSAPAGLVQEKILPIFPVCPTPEGLAATQTGAKSCSKTPPGPALLLLPASLATRGWLGAPCRRAWQRPHLGGCASRGRRLWGRTPSTHALPGLTLQRGRIPGPGQLAAPCTDAALCG